MTGALLTRLGVFAFFLFFFFFSISGIHAWGARTCMLEGGRGI